MDERIFWGTRNKTSSSFVIVGHSLPQVLTAANLPCHTGYPFTPGFLNSFVLLIHKGTSTPTLSLCSDGNKSDLALYVYEILLFLSAPCGGRLLNLTVILLMLPVAPFSFLEVRLAGLRHLLLTHAILRNSM